MERQLILVLTRRCDLRCGFCPQSFMDADMAPETLDSALRRLRPLLAEPASVKLFGGEPLLRPDLVERALRLLGEIAPGTPVELPTNGRGLPAVASLLLGRPEVEVFVSRACAEAGGLPRAVHTLLIAPGETPGRVVRRLLGARALGFSRFNLLPAYFVRWTPAQLEGLRRVFRALALVLRRIAVAGPSVEIVNLARRGSTPLYNDGLVVDTDGEVYSSNLVLARAVEPRRRLLRLGKATGAGRLARRPPADAARVLERSFPQRILACSREADAALTEFCREVEEAMI